jgi:hypothetical protein
MRGVLFDLAALHAVPNKAAARYAFAPLTGGVGSTKPRCKSNPDVPPYKPNPNLYDIAAGLLCFCHMAKHDPQEIRMIHIYAAAFCYECFHNFPFS